MKKLMSLILIFVIIVSTMSGCAEINLNTDRVPSELVEATLKQIQKDKAKHDINNSEILKVEYDKEVAPYSAFTVGKHLYFLSTSIGYYMEVTTQPAKEQLECSKFTCEQGDVYYKILLWSASWYVDTNEKGNVAYFAVDDKQEKIAYLAKEVDGEFIFNWDNTLFERSPIN